jgi:hypothetical protein
MAFPGWHDGLLDLSALPLSRGTDGSNPSPSSGESVSLPNPPRPSLPGPSTRQSSARSVPKVRSEAARLATAKRHYSAATAPRRRERQASLAQARACGASSNASSAPPCDGNGLRWSSAWEVRVSQPSARASSQGRAFRPPALSPDDDPFKISAIRLPSSAALNGFDRTGIPEIPPGRSASAYPVISNALSPG